MITRMAMFNGEVKEGLEGSMRAYVRQELEPLWRKFDGASDVRVLFGVTQDANGPVIPLVLAIDYPDRAAIDRAMASQARITSRDMLPEFYAQFFERVELWHYEFEHKGGP